MKEAEAGGTGTEAAAAAAASPPKDSLPIERQMATKVGAEILFSRYTWLMHASLLGGNAYSQTPTFS